MTMPYRIVFGKKLSHKERMIAQEVISSTFKDIDSTVNNWNVEAEVSQFNSHPVGHPFSSSTLLHRLATLTDKVHKMTEGKFDPSIFPILKKYRKENVLNHQIGWKYLEIKKNSLVKLAPISLDFCGISKGFALDLLAKRLRKAGYENFLCEWAGEIIAQGNHPRKKGWDVSIDGLQSIRLENQAIATSGSYMKKYWEEKGRHYFHIIDPSTQNPLSLEESPLITATVVASNCAIADGIATACMVFYSEEAMVAFAKKLTLEYPEISIWLGSTCQKPSSSI